MLKYTSFVLPSHEHFGRGSGNCKSVTKQNESPDKQKKTIQASLMKFGI